MVPIGITKRFSTDHVRLGSGSAIRVRHSLLPFPKIDKGNFKSFGKGKTASSC